MKTPDYSNLDFLRSIAVLMVVTGHVTFFFGIRNLGPLNITSLGLFGVFIFFVHTSLVLMLSLERQWNRWGRDDLATMFVVRRCFRIYPLSIMVLVLILAFRVPQAVLTPGKWIAATPTAWDIFCNLTLIQNLTKRDSIIGVLWSLPYEMQMYLFLPWLFLLLRPSRSMWRSVLIWILSIALALFALHHLRRIPDMVLFIPCFLPGVIAYQLQRKDRFRLPAFLWPLTIAALTIFHLEGANWALRWGSEARWGTYWASGFILGLVVPRFFQLSARWLVIMSHFIAQYSYGI
jgi:peptidoglycan/LPS O-acetylase OafA/YrhL